MTFRSELTSAQKDLAAAKADLLQAQEHIDDLPPTMGGYTYYQRKVFNEEKKVALAEQKVKYAEVRMVHRKEYVVKAYVEAFQNDSPWPTQTLKDEFHLFQTQRKLASMPRDWNTRVPRWTRGNPQDPSQQKKKAPEGGGHGGGEHGGGERGGSSKSSGGEHGGH